MNRDFKTLLSHVLKIKNNPEISELNYGRIGSSKHLSNISFSGAHDIVFKIYKGHKASVTIKPY